MDFGAVVGGKIRLKSYLKSEKKREKTRFPQRLRFYIEFGPIFTPNLDLQNHNFSIVYAIKLLFHYAHRVGHVFFTQFPPLDSQNDPAGTHL